MEIRGLLPSNGASLRWGPERLEKNLRRTQILMNYVTVYKPLKLELLQMFLQFGPYTMSYSFHKLKFVQKIMTCLILMYFLVPGDPAEQLCLPV